MQIAVKTTVPLGIWKHTISATYDGSSLASWIAMYVDWVAVATTIVLTGLSSSIINWNNQSFVWFDWWWLSTFDGKVRRLSFVDYVKTPGEIATDHTLWTQSVGTWVYLFATDFDRLVWLTFPSSDPAALTMDIVWQLAGDWVLF
jgi:hypothetical protein